jgi:hypothetical protein
MNSMILHEIFFASLGERGEPEGALRDAQNRDVGSVSAWAAEFSAMGKAQRGGSGWVLADLVAARPQARQPMGDGSLDDAGRGAADPRARHVRAFLSHRLRRPGGCLCRCVHGGDQLAERRRRLCQAHARKLTVTRATDTGRETMHS